MQSNSDNLDQYANHTTMTKANMRTGIERRSIHYDKLGINIGRDTRATNSDKG